MRKALLISDIKQLKTC